MVFMDFNEHATHVIAFEAMSFYHGTTNSVNAYANIDRALLSWNYDPAMLNASRELFDAIVDAAMDFDLMYQAALAAAITDSEQWDAIFAKLNATSIRDLTTG